MGNYDRIGELVDSLNSLPVEKIVDLRRILYFCEKCIANK